MPKPGPGRNYVGRANVDGFTGSKGKYGGAEDTRVVVYPTDMNYVPPHRLLISPDVQGTLFPAETISPFWQTTDGRTVRLYLGDVIAVLQRLPSRSVQCAVTSPPYWGLRSYLDDGHDHKHFEIGSEPSPDCGTHGKAQCGRCFICTMVAVFNEVRRVLRDDGTLWLNLGDTYANTGACGGASPVGEREYRTTDRDRQEKMKRTKETYGGLVQGNLVGVPWRTALALQANGWILRSDMPWIKRSSMPESVRNRPAKSLEYVFLLSKQMDYYIDMEAVRKSSNGNWSTADFLPNSEKDKQDSSKLVAATGVSRSNRSTEKVGPNSGRNFRNADLWFESVSPPHGMVGRGDEIVGLDVTAKGYGGAHFAVFCVDLVRPCILAGTSARGCCTKCGAPWERVLSGGAIGRSWHDHAHDDERGNFKTVSSKGYTVGKPLGWQPTCECFGRFEKVTEKVNKLMRVDDLSDDKRDHSIPRNRNGTGQSTLDDKPRETMEVEETFTKYVPTIPLDQHPVVPCVVLDPFMGSGTTAAVCLQHGRHAVGIDLSEKYLRENAIPRIEGECLSRPALSRLVPQRERRK